MTVENLTFLREVIDNALTGEHNPDQLVKALEVIEEMLNEGSETDEVSDDSEADADVTPADVAEADADDLPF
jgi:hypothetical protein